MSDWTKVSAYMAELWPELADSPPQGAQAEMWLELFGRFTLEEAKAALKEHAISDERKRPVPSKVRKYLWAKRDEQRRKDNRERAVTNVWQNLRKQNPEWASLSDLDTARAYHDRLFQRVLGITDGMPDFGPLVREAIGDFAATGADADQIEELCRRVFGPDAQATVDHWRATQARIETDIDELGVYEAARRAMRHTEERLTA